MLFAASSPNYRHAPFFLGRPVAISQKRPICGPGPLAPRLLNGGMTVMQLAVRFLRPSPSPPRTDIRARLDAGTLPPVSSRTWVRRARGRHRCACCGKRIRASGAECEVAGSVAEPYAHMQCFRVWAEESQRCVPESHRPVPPSSRTRSEAASMPLAGSRPE